MKLRIKKYLSANKKNWWKAFIGKKRILYTGTHIKKYTDLGYVTHHPMIQLVAMPDTSDIDKSIACLKEYDLVIFTSAYAVKFFFERIYVNGFDSRIFSSVKVVSIGTHTTSKLRGHGIVPDFQPNDESSLGIVEPINSAKISNYRILLPRSDKAIPFLPEQLEKLGNIVDTVKVYTNIMPENVQKVNPENYDQVIFSSPSCIDNFVKIYGKLPSGPQIISKGEETLKALNRYKFK